MHFSRCVYVHMRGGSGRRVILDADSLCTKDIALYEQCRPRNNSPLSLAWMNARGVIIRFRCRYCSVFLLALTALDDTPVDHARPATTFTYVTRDRD